MAQPPAYNRDTDFARNAGSNTDHNALNAELDRASNAINDIRHNLAVLQADDGRLRPDVVSADAISPTLVRDISASIWRDLQKMLLEEGEGKASRSETFGIAQSWQDVTAGREADAVYINEKEKPVEVRVTVGYSPDTGEDFVTSALRVDDVVVAEASSHAVGTAENVVRHTIGMVVPAGASYACSLNGNLLRWAELS